MNKRVESRENKPRKGEEESARNKFRFVLYSYGRRRVITLIESYFFVVVYSDIGVCMSVAHIIFWHFYIQIIVHIVLLSAHCEHAKKNCRLKANDIRTHIHTQQQ